jgi:peptidoglycan/LPS O-acetylase OafA/YrhL
MGGRNAGIDVLRGIAVLWVVLHHLHLRFVLSHVDVQQLVTKPLASVLFWSGYYAVMIFFVISGFLITSLTLRRWGSLGAIDVPAFYRLRVARIAPCLLLLLAVLSYLHLADVRGYVIEPARASLGRALFAALTFHFNYLEGTRGYLPGAWDVLWSLSIEEAFYVMFPIACRLLRHPLAFGCVLVGLIVIGPVQRVQLADQVPWNEYAYFCCFDGIAFGCLAALLVARVTYPRIALAIGLVAIALIIGFRPLVRQLGLIDSGLNVTLLELGAALSCIAFARGVGERQVARGTGWLRAIGRTSYEIYLAHMFVVLAVVTVYRASGASTRWIGAYYAAALVASVLVGMAVSRWFSEPARRRLSAAPAENRLSPRDEAPPKRV